MKNGPIGSTYTTPGIVNVLRELSPLGPDDFTCTWQNPPNNCHFTETVTDDGICYTLNHLDQSEIYREGNLHSDYRYFGGKRPLATEWSLDAGYLDNATRFSYPHRVFSSGPGNGLDVFISFNQTLVDPLCNIINTGVRIAVHSPGDIPKMTDQYILVNPKQIVSMIIRPNVITSSLKLQTFQAERRQCYLQHERYLQFFKVYTQANCNLECLTNHTLRVCGCVAFSMPRTDSTRICGLKKKPCYEKVVPYEDPDSSLKCNCMPTCNSLEYDVDIFHAEYNKDEFNVQQTSVVTVFFKSSQIITLKRSELYGFSDFLASCGGLLGLFLGVSILSEIELIYFLTVRVWWQHKRNGLNKVRFIGKGN